MNSRISDKNDELVSKIILFDGACVLCNYWAQFIIKYDTHKKFKLASVQSSIGQSLLKYYGMSTTSFDSLIYIEGLSPEDIKENILSIKDGEFKTSIYNLELHKSATQLSGRLFLKTTAIFKILAQLPSPWRFFSFFKIIPTSLSDRVYSIIARNRYKIFGKYDTCILPTADHASRYFSD
jgi:predicted DCC family thiol-disulfide oxidoreductase YuxK